MLKTTKRLVCSLMTLVTALGAVPVLTAQALSYEKNSGMTIVTESLWEAWAWANAWGNTSGRAYARVGSHEMDTGWFQKDCQTARVVGSRTQVYESWAQVK